MAGPISSKRVFKLTEDYFKAIADRAASRSHATAVPIFADDTIKNKAKEMMSEETVTRINPTTQEKEYLLFRGPSEKDITNHMKDGKFISQQASSWTTRPDTASGYANSHSANLEGTPIAAWVPESKVKNFLPANFEKASDVPAHSEVIVDSVNLPFDTFSNHRIDKKMPFDQSIGKLFGNPKKLAAIAPLSIGSETLDAAKDLASQYVQGKDWVSEKLAQQLNLTKNSEVEKQIKNVTDIAVDPTMLIPGVGGIMTGPALEMLAESNKNSFSKIKNLLSNKK